MAGHGVGGDLAIDWPSLMAFKRSFTDPVPAKQERRYAKLGVDAFHGLARFASPDAVAVDGRTLQAQHILIATGRSEEHTSELQSLLRSSYAVFCLQNNKPSWKARRSQEHNSELQTLILTSHHVLCL